MYSFINSKEILVSEAIDVLVATSNGALVRFPTTSGYQVVLRADWNKSKVAIISGGGSGHEPAHAGFVGDGLLAAAVCGEVFASPTVDAVLATIVAVTGEAGCLLVVKNYTGDRLNFGLAAEKAKAMGLRVEMIIIADDIAIPGAVQPRGVAGTLFVHKIAGYLSERGAGLDEILETVTRAKAKIFSIGVARESCTIPGNEKVQRIAAGKVEIGLGIHGEPGVELAEYATSGVLVTELVKRLKAAIGAGDARYALLLNNLGGLSGLEMSALLSDILSSELSSMVDIIFGPAPLMTALDMPGFSISLLELDAGFSEALRAPVGVPAWPAANDIGKIITVASPEVRDAVTYVPSASPEAYRIVETIVQTCLAFEDDLNALDAKVGDGDTGSTFASAARAVTKELEMLPYADGAALLQALGAIKSSNMGGSSGVLFAIMFAAASEAYAETANWTKALLTGLAAMQKYGGAAEGDRTMIDALKPALEALDAGGSMDDAQRAARQGADATAKMDKAKAGRSSYLEARSLLGVTDPGAEAMARIFEALAKRSST